MEISRLQKAGCILIISILCSVLPPCRAQINISPIPGLNEQQFVGSWKFWLAIGIVIATVALVTAFVIRGFVKYKRRKRAEQAAEAVADAAANNLELGNGDLKSNGASPKEIELGYTSAVGDLSSFPSDAVVLPTSPESAPASTHGIERTLKQELDRRAGTAHTLLSSKSSKF